ncbi:hypothetical protein GQ54DRAFT_305194 [Martensiomyces pterosporus]|nr:hypothetical protein GQ54DRAFT_305194 [Martensiomyces pterosporus]
MISWTEMGIREKTDLDLQAVSFAGALLTLLFFWAARGYTQDWRKRRLFRRELTKTQDRIRLSLLKNSEQQHTDNRRRKSTGDLGQQPGGDSDQDEDGDDAQSLQRRRTTGERYSMDGYRNQSTPEEQGSSTGRKRRRGWKRFVAALPLMPLAAAYVVTRLGWDVFELLVFCTIDMALDAMSRSIDTAKRTLAFVRTWTAELVTRLDLKQRIASTAIIIVENTVVWLFNTALPSIGTGIAYCISQMKRFALWWAEAGGPALRDTIEVLVLDGLVPAYMSLSKGVVAAYLRLVWFCARMWEAASLLSLDLARDLRIVCGWVARFGRWVRDGEQWQRLVTQAIEVVVRLTPSRALLLKARSAILDQAVPWLTTALACGLCLAYSRALLPAVRWCVCAGDRLLQHTSGMLVLVFGMIKDSALWERVLLPVFQNVQLYEVAARFVKLVGQSAASARHCVYLQCQKVRALWHKSLWILNACRYAYSQARRVILLPAVEALTTLGSHLWKTVLSPLAQSAAAVLRGVPGNALRRIALQLLLQVRKLAHLVETYLVEAVGKVQVRQWVWQACIRLASSALAARIRELAGVLQKTLSDHAERLLAALWPVTLRSWNDSVQALADMSRQLVSMVDLIVATVGDLIVDFARRNTVHVSDQPPHADVGAKHKSE